MALLISMFVKVENGSCHEMFLDSNGNPIYLKWNYTTRGVAQLKVNGDILEGDYYVNYEESVDAWNNASSSVNFQYTSYSSSNVDLGTSESDYWKSEAGDDFRLIYGLCRLYTTDGKTICNENGDTENARLAKSSSKYVSYAQCHFNPDMSRYKNDDWHIRQVMVHELGHALCLGHPDTLYNRFYDDSVMHSTRYDDSFYTPRKHDKDDVNRKYVKY